jgi:hypothetical protein
MLRRNLLVFALLCSPASQTAWAHRVHLRVTAPATSPHVLVEVFYDDGTQARHAEVKVQDEKGQEIASGKTDHEGNWTFTRPAAGLYRVFVNAGAGHRARDSIVIEDDKELTAPTREQLARYPWEWLLAGLGLMAAAAGALTWWRRRTRMPADA